MACGRFCLFGWVLFYVPHLVGRGLAPMLAVSLAALAGVCNTVSRAAHGLLIDLGLLRAEYLYLISTSVMVVSLVLDPFLQSYGASMAIGLAFGVASGISLPIGTVFIKQSVKPEDFVSSVSWSYCFSGIARMLAGYGIGM